MERLIAFLDVNGVVTGLHLMTEAEASAVGSWAPANEDTVVGDTYVNGEWRLTGNREPAEPPEPPTLQPTTDERVEALEHENKTLQAQLEAMIQSNQMLEDCLVEMAGAVYA